MSDDAQNREAHALELAGRSIALSSESVAATERGDLRDGLRLIHEARDCLDIATYNSMTPLAVRAADAASRALNDAASVYSAASGRVLTSRGYFLRSTR